MERLEQYLIDLRERVRNLDNAIHTAREEGNQEAIAYFTAKQETYKLVIQEIMIIIMKGNETYDYSQS